MRLSLKKYLTSIQSSLLLKEVLHLDNQSGTECSKHKGKQSDLQKQPDTGRESLLPDGGPTVLPPRPEAPPEPGEELQGQGGGGIG